MVPVYLNVLLKNNTVLQILPFPGECDDNIFVKPPEIKRKPDISSYDNVTVEQINSSQSILTMMEMRMTFLILW